MRGMGKYAIAFVSVALLQVGCQRLDYERTVSVDPTEVQAILIDPPRAEQKVSVTASSPGAAINIYLVLEQDQETAKQALLDGKTPDKPLAGKEKTEEATLEATIPAKKGYAVLLSTAAGKKAEVKLKVTGK